jgi:NodT family efflux transporter outer membrane factor (OMF) lipoprotein
MQPLLESAIGRERAAQAQVQAARMLLATSIAARWTELARLIEMQTLSERSLAQRETMLGLVAQRQAAGLDTVLELRQAEGLIAQTRVELEVLAESAQRERHALAELSGQVPQVLQALRPELAALRPVPVPDQIAVDLLGRRADLVALRHTVAALEGDVALARVQFLPNVNLLAFAGLSSIGLGKLLDLGSRTYGVGPALRLPLFEAPRLQARLDEQQALRDGAVEAYNQTLIAALREVADEVTSLMSIERQRRAQAQALSAAEAAYALATQRYQAGLANFLTVLTVENNVIAQRRLDADLKARELAAGIALARALGGGYRSDKRPNSP